MMMLCMVIHLHLREGDVSDSTIASNAADLKGLIEKLGIGPVHLVGHSYGGFTAAFLATDYPDLIRTLVLVEPAIATLLVEDPTSATQVLSLLFRSPSVALSARRFQSKSFAPAIRALDSGQNDKAVQLTVDGVGHAWSVRRVTRLHAEDDAR
jgi:non-heme chloroperoxidase